jgi:hypothetical protein
MPTPRYFLLHSGDSCTCNGAGYYVAGGVKAAAVVALFSFHE